MNSPTCPFPLPTPVFNNCSERAWFLIQPPAWQNGAISRMGWQGGFSTLPGHRGLLYSAAPERRSRGPPRASDPMSAQLSLLLRQGLSPDSLPSPSALQLFSLREEGGKLCWQIAEQGFLPQASLPLSLPPPHSWGFLCLCLPEESAPGGCQEPLLRKLIASLPQLRNRVLLPREAVGDSCPSLHLLWPEEDVPAGQQGLVMSSSRKSFLSSAVGTGLSTLHTRPGASRTPRHPEREALLLSSPDRGREGGLRFCTWQVQCLALNPSCGQRPCSSLPLVQSVQTSPLAVGPPHPYLTTCTPTPGLRLLQTSP